MDANAATCRFLVRLGGPVPLTAGSTVEPLPVVVEEGQRAEPLRDDVPADVAARALLDVYRGALYRWSGGTTRIVPAGNGGRGRHRLQLGEAAGERTPSAGATAAQAHRRLRLADPVSPT